MAIEVKVISRRINKLNTICRACITASTAAMDIDNTKLARVFEQALLVANEERSQLINERKA